MDANGGKAQRPVDAGGVPARLIFDRFPHGLLVMGATGTVVSLNEQARRVLGRPELAARGRGASCCALLGCHDPAGPLGEICLTERALELGGVLPDVRIDLEGGEEPRAVWVTASPLTAEHVVMELRPGRAGDRRRRTDPHWTAGPALQLEMLGRTRVLSPEGPLEGAWLRQRPGQLLKLLVCNRHRVTHTDEIAITFWPETERTALQNVRHFVHGLRTQLEPNRERRAPSAFIIAHEGGYGLNQHTVRVDADEFEEQARSGLGALARGDDDAARTALERAAALYRGEFLADEPYAEWAFAERGRLHELACGAVSALAEIELRAGLVPAAIGHLQRLAELEPLDAEVQRRLISQLLASGRSGEAMRRHRQAQAAWSQAFGEPLPFALAELRRARPDSLKR